MLKNAEECCLLQKSDPPTESDDVSSGDRSEKDVWTVQGKDSYFMLWSGQRENTKSMVKASYYFEWKKTIHAFNSMVFIHACYPLH